VRSLQTLVTFYLMTHDMHKLSNSAMCLHDSAKAKADDQRGVVPLIAVVLLLLLLLRHSTRVHRSSLHMTSK